MRNFFQTFGDLPMTWLNLLLSLIGGFSQGVGLALFVPLLELMDSPSGENVSSIARLFSDIFLFFGLPFNLPIMLFGIVFLLTLGLLSGFAQRSLLAWSMTHHVARSRARIVDAVFHSSWPHLSQQSTGEITNVLLNNVFRTGAGLSFQVDSVATLFQFTIYLLFGLALSWQLFGVTFFFFFLGFWALRPIQRKVVRLGETILHTEQDYTAVLVDYVKNIKLIKVTGSEGFFLNRLETRQNKIARIAAAKLTLLAGTYFSSQALAVFLCAVIIAVAKGALDISTSQTLVFLLFLARSSPLIARFHESFQGYRSELPAIRKVAEVLSECESHREESIAGKSDFPGLKKEITIEDVSYGFPGADGMTVKGINLSIGTAQMVAIVGPSGAGKSTLVELICGLRQPSVGRILVDGRNLKDLNLQSWRSRFGYVTQDVIVFNDTLRNNIAFAHPEAEKGDIDKAIEVAHLKEVVDGLPQGLETVMGESGVRLSGGQKQRLALARALVGNPELLLLDEATSALDNESERFVQQAIEAIAHRFTMVVVAHRLSTIRKADLICVMDQGRIVETGNYDELLAQGGLFKQLHDLQFH